MSRAHSRRSRGALRGLGHLVVLEKAVTEPFKTAFGRIKDHIKSHITGKANGISNGETVHKIKKLMKELEAEKSGQAEEMQAILAQRGEEQYFVHPTSGHVYAVTGRYPYRISGILPAVWGFLDGFTMAPLMLLGDASSGSAGLAYTTYDAWGRPVYGMPIPAYKESEQERFMESMERQEAPGSRFITTGRQEYGLPNGRYMHEVPSGMSGLVDGLLGDNCGLGAVWRLDNVVTSHYYTPTFGVPYQDKTGKLRMALGRQQWEAEDQYRKLVAAGVVEVPYQGEVNPTQFGFDIATRM